MNMPERTILHHLGNKGILEYQKTAFLCSRKCPADIILKSLDWAREQKENGKCIISGFHSRIEKDVFDILIRGNQPLILVLARGIKERWPEQIRKAVENERLLIISPFGDSEKYITQENANKRNKIMTEIADEIFLAYNSINGNLHKLVNTLKDKKINTF